MPDQTPAADTLAALVRDLRAAAAERYRPDHVRVLLVGHAPPTADDRYFYFEDVRDNDSLFLHVAKGVLGATPQRSAKAEALARLKDLGFFLIDVSPDPAPPKDLTPLIPALVRRVEALQPEAIILIKADVYDHASTPLKAAGQPVVNIRMPFPGSGRQREFLERFAVALSSVPGSPA